MFRGTLVRLAFVKASTGAYSDRDSLRTRCSLLVDCLGLLHQGLRLIVLSPFSCVPPSGITGLPVVPNAREVLISLYSRTIERLEHYGTDGKSYNMIAYNLTKDRLEQCVKFEEVPDIEDAIACGQVEELIQCAEDELELLELMNTEFKPWERKPIPQEEDGIMDPFGTGEPGGPVVIWPPPPGFQPVMHLPYPGFPFTVPPKNAEELKAMWEVCSVEQAEAFAAQGIVPTEETGVGSGPLKRPAGPADAAAGAAKGGAASPTPAAK